MIEPGRYRAKAHEWGIGAAGTGTKQVCVEFDLLDTPGQTISWYGYFSEKALARTVESLRHMGWQGSDLSDLAEHGGALDTNEVILVVEHEQDKDEAGNLVFDEAQQPVVRARVRWVNGLGGIAMKNQLAGDDLKAFGAAMRGKILALDPNGAAKRAAGGQAPKKPTPPAKVTQYAKPPPPVDGPIGPEPPPAAFSDPDIPF